MAFFRPCVPAMAAQGKIVHLLSLVPSYILEVLYVQATIIDSVCNVYLLHILLTGSSFLIILFENPLKSNENNTITIKASTFLRLAPVSND